MCLGRGGERGWIRKRCRYSGDSEEVLAASSEQRVVNITVRTEPVDPTRTPIYVRSFLNCTARAPFVVMRVHARVHVPTLPPRTMSGPTAIFMQPKPSPPRPTLVVPCEARVQHNCAPCPSTLDRTQPDSHHPDANDAPRSHVHPRQLNLREDTPPVKRRLRAYSPVPRVLRKRARLQSQSASPVQVTSSYQMHPMPHSEASDAEKETTRLRVCPCIFV